MKHCRIFLLLMFLGAVGCSSSAPSSPGSGQGEPTVPGPLDKDGKPDAKKPGFG